MDNRKLFLLLNETKYIVLCNNLFYITADAGLPLVEGTQSCIRERRCKEQSSRRFGRKRKNTSHSAGPATCPRAYREIRAMDIQAEGFFREATLRICGSLNIATAMDRCFQYLKHFIPMAGMGLQVYEPDTNTARN
jgi:hypothetical protein